MARQFIGTSSPHDIFLNKQFYVMVRASMCTKFEVLIVSQLVRGLKQTRRQMYEQIWDPLLPVCITWTEITIIQNMIWSFCHCEIDFFSLFFLNTSPISDN